MPSLPEETIRAHLTDILAHPCCTSPVTRFRTRLRVRYFRTRDRQVELADMRARVQRHARLLSPLDPDAARELGRRADELLSPGF